MKIAVPVTKTTYGEIILDLSELDVDRIVKNPTNMNVAKRRSRQKAIECFEKYGEKCITWFPVIDPEDEYISITSGFRVIEEEQKKGDHNTRK